MHVQSGKPCGGVHLTLSTRPYPVVLAGLALLVDGRARGLLPRTGTLPRGSSRSPERAGWSTTCHGQQGADSYRHCARGPAGTRACWRVRDKPPAAVVIRRVLWFPCPKTKAVSAMNSIKARAFNSARRRRAAARARGKGRRGIAIDPLTQVQAAGTRASHRDRSPLSSGGGP